MKWLVFAVALYVLGLILAATAPRLFPIGEPLASELLRSASGLGGAFAIHPRQAGGTELEVCLPLE